MKPRNKKLLLSKETLRSLTNLELGKAIGAVVTNGDPCTAETIFCVSETGGCTVLCESFDGCGI